MPDPLASPPAAPAVPPSAPAAAPRRALVPREHGAWGQLALPLLAGLLIGRPGAAALLLTAAVVLAFVAHEPLLVLLGHRGVRMRSEDGARAWRWLIALGGAAAITGVAGVVLAPAAARAALLLPAGLAVIVAVLVVRREEKTVPGEVAVASALAGAGWVVALAGDAAPRAALAGLLAWILSFAAATLAVQVILARARSKGARDPGRLHAALAAALLAAAIALAAAGLPLALPLATAPTALLSIVVCLTRVSPKRLRTLGWTMVGSSLATLAILVLGLR